MRSDLVLQAFERLLSEALRQAASSRAQLERSRAAAQAGMSRVAITKQRLRRSLELLERLKTMPPKRVTSG
jgi:hypothetical protein